MEDKVIESVGLHRERRKGGREDLRGEGFLVDVPGPLKLAQTDVVVG